MKTLRKISHAPLAWLALLTLLMGLAVAVKLTVKAQEVIGSGSSPGWQDMDIGPAPAAGGAQADGAGSYIVDSSGGDIWGTTDSFNYQYQTLNGNGQIVARVSGLEGTNAFTKAGVMIRETLDANARNATMLVTLSRGTFFQWRSVTGGNSDQTLGNTNVVAPHWVKLVRNGDWIGGYSSPDGVSWTLVGWEVISGLPSQIYAGLAVASHHWGWMSSAAFDQVSMSPVDPLEVLNPLVGTGDGLAGSYYPNRHLYGKPATNRVDGTVNFDFGYLVRQGATNGTAFTNQCLAVLGMPKGQEYGIRWVGEVQAQFSEPYTFSVDSDDGVRVWVNEELVINDWVSHPTKENLATTVNLVAGQKYLLRVEYFENHGAARMKLSWSSPSTPQRVIPQSQLYSQPTDADNNGLPDLWEQHYFGQTGVDPNADPDGDGLSNLQEWQRHSNPTDLLNWGVPNEWTHGDIEEWGGSDGDASYGSGVFTLSSFGRDIWDRHDAFHYLYQPLGTNGEIVTRVLAMGGTNGFAKVGLMVRETLASDARNAMLLMMPSNGLRFQWRGAIHRWTEDYMWKTNPPLPYWLKLVRNNDWLGGYTSADGTNWTLMDWETLKGLKPRVFVGMGVTAHNHKAPGGASTGQFDQVTLGSADPAEVMNPVVGDGDGLLGNFRNDSLLYLPGFTNQVDESINFWWAHNPPRNTLNPDNYGICWSGEVQAQFSEPYTFYLNTWGCNWVRVWINDQLVVDQWRKLHTNGKYKGTIDLVAGQRYLIRVEMFNNHGHGSAALSWSSPSTPERIVPQGQLYSQPLDADGNGLPDTWETLYFGHTGVNPNADPDGDGLSNLQEYRYHTNPLKADTDGDGMPDAWEIAHGLDPQFNDASLDYDNDGWSNLQDYLYGLDPNNADANGDGLPDSFEVGYLGVGVNTSHADLASVAVLANGAQATNLLGNWQVDGSDIFALDRRGGLDFVLSVSNADKYVFNLIGTQNQPNPFETRFKLLLSIDGQTLGHYTLNAGYVTNGTVELVLPYLKAGSHTVHLFWDGVASYSSLRIKQVKLLSVSGSDANHNGIKDWAEAMIASESGLDTTNVTIISYASPVCLEGRNPYSAFMVATNNLTNALSPVATTDGRWYVNVPLQAGTQTVFQASYQNGALVEPRKLQWLPVNLLTNTSSLTIRKGDSLLFSVLPAGTTNGNAQIIIGTNTYAGKASKLVTYKFTTAGSYVVTGTYTSTSGSSQSGSVTVKVVQQNLPNEEPAAWTWMQRNLNLANLAPEAVLQADSRLACTFAGTNANGATKLTLGMEENEQGSIIARLGTNGPVLDSTQVSGFDVWSGDQAYTKTLQIYPDGSQLVEMLVISSPVNTNVTFVLEPIVSGVMFEDGTTTRTLTSTNFDALGQCPVRFIRPAAARTSVCNSVKAYQGNYQLGYRH